MTNRDDSVDAVGLWLAWKQANEQLRSAIIRDVGAHSTVGEPERTVLIHVHAAGGVLRQNALAAATGWDRGRLSHLLTRMEDQQLVTRERLTNGVEVAITSTGERVWREAEASLRSALEHHIVRKLGAEGADQLRGILGALAQDGAR